MNTKILVAAGLAMASPFAVASAPWVGTANYLVASGASGTDEALVGPFDTYDFGTGIALITPDTTIGLNNTFTGYFQTQVDGHFLAAQGINVPQLDISGGTNFTGNGNGFELTLVSEFHGTYSNVSANSLDFTVDSGNAKLYFDTNPNYSFANDTGFNNGSVILQGGIASGQGTIILPNVVGIGVEQVELDFSGIFGSFQSAVYEPDTLSGGTALFSIKTKTALNQQTPIIDAVWGGNRTVEGHLATSIGQLSELDGKLQLTSVPVPTAAWLFGTGLAGLLGANKRKKSAA